MPDQYFKKKKKRLYNCFFQRQENNDFKKKEEFNSEMDQPKKGKKFHTNRNGFVQAFLHTTKRINRLDKQFRLVSTCYFFPKNLKKKSFNCYLFFLSFSHPLFQPLMEEKMRITVVGVSVSFFIFFFFSIIQFLCLCRCSATVLLAAVP